MLNINQIIGKEVADNEITINGTVIGKVTDTVAQQILEIVMGGTQQLVSQPAVQSTSKAPLTPVNDSMPNVSCKWSVEKVFDASGKTFYRLDNGIFTAGKWYQSKYDANTEYRKTTNLEANYLANKALKEVKGIKEATMAGGWKAYGFSTEKAAKAVLEQLPAKIDGKLIGRYIQDHGRIKQDTYYRDKTTGEVRRAPR